MDKLEDAVDKAVEREDGGEEAKQGGENDEEDTGDEDAGGEGEDDEMQTDDPESTPKACKKKKKYALNLVLYSILTISLRPRAEDDVDEMSRGTQTWTVSWTTHMRRNSPNKRNRKEEEGAQFNSTPHRNDFRTRAPRCATVQRSPPSPTTEEVLFGSTELYQDDRKCDGICHSAVRQYPVPTRRRY